MSASVTVRPERLPLLADLDVVEVQVMRGERHGVLPDGITQIDYPFGRRAVSSRHAPRAVRVAACTRLFDPSPVYVSRGQGTCRKSQSNRSGTN